MENTYLIVTLGCKVNTYESEALKEALENRGYKEDKKNPKVVIINTCSVTSVSDQKCRQKIRSLIKKYPNTIFVAMGCYVQMASGYLSTIPGVDILVGTSMRSKIPDLIEEYEKNGKLIDIVSKVDKNEKYENLGISSFHDNTRAFLKIEDGCDNYCSYCVIPYARGEVRSRKKEDILLEVGRLIQNGFQEIVLTGIHTGGYGKDLDNYHFSDLLEDILKTYPSLHRLRISSIEESEIDDKMIALMKEYPTIANHLHIPLQSGSETVLRRMNRKYDKKAYLEKLKKIREVRPDISITTDIIVGFPNESEEEFMETYEFAKACSFSKIHVFPFSSREGTPASKMTPQVDPTIKKERVHRLLTLSNELEEAYESRFIGQEIEVLFEEYDEETKINKGHTSNYLLVTVLCEKNLHNHIQKVLYQKGLSILK